MAEDRIQLRNPDPKKAGPKIDRRRYEVVRREILLLLPKASPGITWVELRDAVDVRLGTKLRGGNNWWHTSVVKLHLEAIGALKRSGAAPQRLVRAK